MQPTPALDPVRVKQRKANLSLEIGFATRDCMTRRKSLDQRA